MICACLGGCLVFFACRQPATDLDLAIGRADRPLLVLGDGYADSPVYGPSPAPADHGRIAVLPGSMHGLIAWEEQERFPGQTTRVYLTRWSDASTMVDVGGIALPETGSVQLTPHVGGQNGSSGLVVWNSDAAIFGVRIDTTSGAVVEAQPHQISGTGKNASGATVAGNGTDYLVVWAQGVTDQTDIYGWRLSTAGVPLDSQPFVISSAANAQHHPLAIPKMGSANYFVVWFDDRAGAASNRIYGSRVDGSTGSALDPSGLPLVTSGSPKSMDLVAGSSQQLLVWSSNNNVLATRMTIDGTVLDPIGIVVADGPHGEDEPRVAESISNNYLVVWRDDRSGVQQIYGGRVSTAGAVLDPGGKLLRASPTHASQPDVAFYSPAGDPRWAMSWKEGGTIWSMDIEMSAAPPAGAIPTIVNRTGNRERNPAIAFDGQQYLVVWEDWRLTKSMQIYGARIDASTGNSLDPSGIAISLGNFSQGHPKVAYGGGTFYVVWQDERNAPFRNIYGTAISPAGVVGTAQGTRVSAAGAVAERPSIAYNGKDFLVAFGNAGDGSPQAPRTIGGRRVKTDGTLLDVADLQLSPPGTTGISPAVIAGKDQVLVAWYASGGQSSAIYGSRVDSGGVALDTTGAGLAIGTATFVDPYGPLAGPGLRGAFDGTNYFVVWGNTTAVDAGTIQGRRVDLNGTVIDSQDVVVTAAPGLNIMPQVAFDGFHFIVAHSADPTPAQPSTQLATIRRVGRDGVPLPESPYALANSDVGYKSSLEYLALASNGGGAVNLAHARIASPPALLERIWIARLVWKPLGLICGAPAECASGYCSAGSCCDSPCANGTCTTGICIALPDAGVDSPLGMPDLGADQGLAGDLAKDGADASGPMDGTQDHAAIAKDMTPVAPDLPGDAELDLADPQGSTKDGASVGDSGGGESGGVIAEFGAGNDWSTNDEAARKGCQCEVDRGSDAGIPLGLALVLAICLFYRRRCGRDRIRAHPRNSPPWQRPPRREP
jgi:hypothetical protein